MFSLLDIEDEQLMGQRPIHPLMVKITIFWDVTPCSAVDRSCILI